LRDRTFQERGSSGAAVLFFRFNISSFFLPYAIRLFLLMGRIRG